jgi:hypothetical protein
MKQRATFRERNYNPICVSSTCSAQRKKLTLPHPNFKSNIEGHRRGKDKSEEGRKNEAKYELIIDLHFGVGTVVLGVTQLTRSRCESLTMSLHFST